MSIFLRGYKFLLGGILHPGGGWGGVYFSIGMSILFWELYRPIFCWGYVLWRSSAYGDMVMVGLHV